MEAQIAECLNASLNADPNTRMSGELRLAELLPDPGLLETYRLLTLR